MGLRNALRLVDSALEAASPAPAALLPIPEIASPFPQDRSTLSTIVWADLLGKAGMPCTRAEAMSVPAVAKARHVVAPKIAGYPLVALKADARVDPQPAWLSAAGDPNELSPWHRMVWTVDDLIFTGWSLWAVERGADTFPIGSPRRIARHRWHFDAQGALLIDEAPVADSRSVVLIPGPHEGILTYGATTIRHASQLLAAAASAGSTPATQLDLHYTGDAPMAPEDIDEVVDRWVTARQVAGHGVGFTNRLIEARELGRVDPALLIEGRNAAAVDCARIIGVAAGMVDATAPKSSLNYETQEGRGLEHTEYGVEPYLEAVEARLSLDDCVPRGTRVAFDRSRDLGPIDPTGPVTED